MTASASISISSIFWDVIRKGFKIRRACTDLNQRIRPCFIKGSQTQFSKRCKCRFSSTVKNEETRRIRQHENPQTEKDSRDELQAERYSPGQTPWNYSRDCDSRTKQQGANLTYYFALENRSKIQLHTRGQWKTAPALTATLGLPVD